MFIPLPFSRASTVLVLRVSFLRTSFHWFMLLFGFGFGLVCFRFLMFVCFLLLVYPCNKFSFVAFGSRSS